jgi:pSer/pThr/pTyr-binding forkhead associated (FHA) protein
MLKLVISDNEGTTTVVPFVRDEISIGRKDGNTIRLIERNISRKHCTLERVNGSYKVRDHGSYNGVIVNGARIEREADLKAGDQLQIGDYTVLVQDEAAEVPAPRSPTPPPPPPSPEALETEPTRVQPLPRAPASAARLVVLTAPLAGAEFTLPDRGELRLGRAEDLEVTIDHRSVSREHARIVCDGGQVRLVDRGSSNGVVVNGERITDATLAAGDVIELGEVLVRFVGSGETYVFDPAEARRLLRARRGGSKGALAIAGGIVLVSVLAALWIVSDGDDEPVADAAPPTPTSNVTPLPAAEAAPSNVSEDQRFGELLGACRAALTGGRFAESMAHAQQALKLRPASSEAAACHTEARAQHEQEQAFVRAKAAYEAGDLAGAQAELELLMPKTPLAARADVSALVLSVGEARVAEAEMLAGRDLVRAQDIAGGALKIPLLPNAQRTRAQAVMAKAPEPQASAPASRATKPREPSARPAERDGKPPIEVASACLAKGDNACVVRALQGKAQSAQELGLLIETYRAMGNTAQAQKHMALYVQRFPTARRAETYRIMLERQNP